jgi:hypothetical protein
MRTPRPLTSSAAETSVPAGKSTAGKSTAGPNTAAGKTAARIMAGPALVVTLTALALSGCGTTPAPMAGSGTGSAAASAPAADRSSAATSPAPAASSEAASSARASSPAVDSSCPASALKITLKTAAAGVAAGSSLVPLEIENASGSSCTLPDYPDVAFATSSAGPDIGGPATQQHAALASAVVLAPGALAHAWLQITDAANYPASACKPVTARGLRVGFAPAAATAFVSKAIPACALKPNGSSILAVFPVQAGPARRGTAP